MTFRVVFLLCVAWGAYGQKPAKEKFTAAPAPVGMLVGEDD